MRSEHRVLQYHCDGLIFFCCLMCENGMGWDGMKRSEIRERAPAAGGEGLLRSGRSVGSAKGGRRRTTPSFLYVARQRKMVGRYVVLRYLGR